MVSLLGRILIAQSSRSKLLALRCYESPFGSNYEKKILNCIIEHKVKNVNLVYFHYVTIIPLGHSFGQTLISFIKGCFATGLVKVVDRF